MKDTFSYVHLFANGRTWLTWKSHFIHYNFFYTYIESITADEFTIIKLERIMRQRKNPALCGCIEVVEFCTKIISCSYRRRGGAMLLSMYDKMSQGLLHFLSGLIRSTQFHRAINLLIHYKNDIPLHISCSHFKLIEAPDNV